MERHLTGVSKVIDPLHDQIPRLRGLVPFAYLESLLRSSRETDYPGRRCDVILVPAPRIIDEDPGKAFRKVLDALQVSYGTRFKIDLPPGFDDARGSENFLGEHTFAALAFHKLRLGPASSMSDGDYDVDPELLVPSTSAMISAGQPFLADAYTIGVMLLTNPRFMTDLPDWFTLSSRDLVFFKHSSASPQEYMLEFMQTGPGWDDTPLLQIGFQRHEYF